MSELISGKEAYRLIGDGVEIEARVEIKENLWRWEDAKHLPACDILNDGFDFRLKPRTTTINGIEVPATFNPKEGEVFYYINDYSEYGYDWVNYCDNLFNNTVWIGKWRTENEVKQVITALRSVFNTK